MAIQEEVIREFWGRRALGDQFCWAGLETDNAIIVINNTRKGDLILSLGCGDMSTEEMVAASGRLVTGVDYIEPLGMRSHKNMAFRQDDIRNFSPGRIFDDVMIFGVANFLTDHELRRVYEKARMGLKDKGKILVKHQSIIQGDDKPVDTTIDGIRYQALYRSVIRDVQILASVFDDVKLQLAYNHNRHKRHPDSDFYLYTGTYHA